VGSITGVAVVLVEFVVLVVVVVVLVVLVVVVCALVVVIGWAAPGHPDTGTPETGSLIPKNAKSMASWTGTVCPTPAAEYATTSQPYVVRV
jgi:hypothetical protein